MVAVATATRKSGAERDRDLVSELDDFLSALQVGDAIESCDVRLP